MRKNMKTNEELNAELLNDKPKTIKPIFDESIPQDKAIPSKKSHFTPAMKSHKNETADKAHL